MNTISLQEYSNHEYYSRLCPYLLVVSNFTQKIYVWFNEEPFTMPALFQQLTKNSCDLLNRGFQAYRFVANYINSCSQKKKKKFTKTFFYVKNIGRNGGINNTATMEQGGRLLFSNSQSQKKNTYRFCSSTHTFTSLPSNETNKASSNSTRMIESQPKDKAATEARKKA